MRKSISEEAYRGTQEAKKACDAAAGEAGQDAARALYKKASEKLDGLSKTELRIWRD